MPSFYSHSHLAPASDSWQPSLACTSLAVMSLLSCHACCTSSSGPHETFWDWLCSLSVILGDLPTVCVRQQLHSAYCWVPLQGVAAPQCQCWPVKGHLGCLRAWQGSSTWGLLLVTSHHGFTRALCEQVCVCEHLCRFSGIDAQKHDCWVIRWVCFLINCWSVCQSGSPTHIPISVQHQLPHSQHWASPPLFMVAIPTWEWHLIVVVICIFPWLTVNIFHVFICIYTFSSVKWPFMSFAHRLIGSFGFFTLEFWELLCSLESMPLPHSLPICSLSLHPLPRAVSVCLKSRLCMFPFMDHVFGV